MGGRGGGGEVSDYHGAINTVVLIRGAVLKITKRERSDCVSPKVIALMRATENVKRGGREMMMMMMMMMMAMAFIISRRRGCCRAAPLQKGSLFISNDD